MSSGGEGRLRRGDGAASGPAPAPFDPSTVGIPPIGRQVLSRRAVGAVLVVAGSLGLAGSASWSSPLAVAQAPSSGTYSGAASADGVRVTYEIAGFLPADRLMDGGAPVAQAAVSPLESVGFASVPYPGETVVSSTGLVGGAAGVPLPGYPLAVSSHHPGQPESAVDQGAARMSASSTASSSTASADAGGPADGSASLGSSAARAEVVHDEASGTVTATATATAEAFTVAGVFRIGRVESLAKVVDAPDGEPQREVSLDVGEVTIAGQTVVVTEAGLALPGSSTPLPDASPLLSALTDQGIEVRYLTAEETPDGVVAPGIEVRFTHPIPGATAPGVAVYRFGQAAASATGGLGSFTDDVATAPVAPVAPAAPGSSDVGDSSVGGSPALPAAPVTSPAAGTTGSDGTPVAAPAQADASPIVAGIPQWSRTWTMAFYLVIALSGLVAVSGAQLIRLLGVRMPWTS